MNIVLIGMRGSGKTSVAYSLSKQLSLRVFDTDRMLEKKVGMKLSDFVKNNGWDAFRAKESEIVRDLIPVTNAVISTGGGIILRKENIEILQKNGTVVFLKTTMASMINRIKHTKNRPSLTDKKTLEEELEQVWKERKELYEGYATFTIITDNKTVEQISKEIIHKL